MIYLTMKKYKIFLLNKNIILNNFLINKKLFNIIFLFKYFKENGFFYIIFTLNNYLLKYNFLKYFII